MDYCRPKSVNSPRNFSRSRRGRNSREKHFAKFRQRIRERRRFFRENRRIAKRARKYIREAALQSDDLTAKKVSKSNFPRVPPRGRKGTKGKARAVDTALVETESQDTSTKTINNVDKSTKSRKRRKRISKEIKHYNRIGDKRSEFTVAAWNTRSKIRATAPESRLYEIINEAIVDHIGFLGLVEHRDIFDDAPHGKVLSLPTGWKWIAVSAECGPSGHSNVGGVGALISPKFNQAYLSHEVISPRLLAVVFKHQPAKDTQRARTSNNVHKIHIVVNYSHTATPGNEEASVIHYELLSNYITSVPLGDVVIVLGDFNATVETDLPLSSSQSARGKHRRVLYSPKVENQNGNSAVFREFLEQNDMYPINTRFRQSNNNDYYTFYGPRGRRARLDHILVRGKWASGFRSVEVRDAQCYKSDHKMVIARGKWKLCRQQKQTPQNRYDFSKLKDPPTAERFLKSISEKYEFNPDVSLDDTFNSFVAAYNETCVEVQLPCQTRRQRRVPWEDFEIVDLRAKRQAARRKYRNTRTDICRQTVNELSAEITLKYRERFEEHIKDSCQRIADNLVSNRVDIAYQLLNEICGWRTHSSSTRIKGDSADDRLKCWYEHFSKVVFSSSDNAGHTDMGADEERPPAPELVPVLPAETEQLFNTSDFSVAEIECVVSTMSNGKATGIDGIPAEVYKIPGFLHIVVGIINAAFNKSDVPQQWRTLIVVPVPKKGDLSLPTNYRGISLMCIIAKIYNKALLLRVRKVLDSRLNGIQNGFRPSRSTIPHIVTLRGILRYCLANNDLSLIIVFIDYTKAFDSVRWDQLKAILVAYRLPLKIVNAIMSLYKGATARVRTSDGLTDVINLCRGVLQGDTFAPYLFVIVMDYIIHRVDIGLGLAKAGFTFPRTDLEEDRNNTRGVKNRNAARASFGSHARNCLGQRFLATLFADDASLLAGGLKSLIQTLFMVQRHLGLIEGEGKPLGLEINPPKTVGMGVTKGKLVTSKLDIRLQSGKELGLVRDYNFLGSLLLSDHSDMRKRLRSGWVAIRKLAKFWKSDISSHVKITFFNTICQTVFLYPSATWVMDAKMEATLNGCYTRMLRFVKGLNYADHPTIETIYGNMPTVVEIIAKRRLTMIGTAFQYETSVDQPMTRFMWELAARRSVDQTKKSWDESPRARSYLDQLYEDLARVGRGSATFFATVVSWMKDARGWPKLVEEICKKYPRPAPLTSGITDRIKGTRMRAGTPAPSSTAAYSTDTVELPIRRPTPLRSVRPLTRAGSSEIGAKIVDGSTQIPASGSVGKPRLIRSYGGQLRWPVQRSTILLTWITERSLAAHGVHRRG